MDIKKIENLDTQVLADKAGSFLRKRNQWVIVLLAIGMLVYGGILWNRYILNFGWSDAQKQEYVQSKEKEVVFNKNRFDRVVYDIEMRKTEYQKNLDGIQDIFRIK